MKFLENISADPDMHLSILDDAFRHGLPKSPDFNPREFRSSVEKAGSIERAIRLNPGYEAVVELIGRPALTVRHDSFETPISGQWAKILKKERSVIEGLIPSVGRIEVRDHPRLRSVGTGWVAGENLIVTNRHVAEKFAKSTEDGFGYRTNFRGRQMVARIDFREEHRLPHQEEYDVVSIPYIAGEEEPDVAFLRVESRSSSGRPLSPAIHLAPQRIDSELDVGVIGYPERDSERNPGPEVDRIFNNIYDVKRLSPGKAWPSQFGDWYIEHDAQSLGGSSGSVVFDLSTGYAVGLHFGGVYRESNYAVSSHKLVELMSQLSLE